MDYERLIEKLRERADAEASALGCGGSAGFHTEGPLLEAPSSTGGKCWYAVGYVAGNDGLVLTLHGSTQAVAAGRGIAIGGTVRCRPAEVAGMVDRMTRQKEEQAGKGYRAVHLPMKRASEAEFFALTPAGAMVGAPVPAGCQPYPLDGIPLPDDPNIVRRRVEQAVKIAWQYGDRFAAGRPFQQGLVAFTPRDGRACWHAVLGRHECACVLGASGQVTVQYMGAVVPDMRPAVDVEGVRFTPYGRGDCPAAPPGAVQVTNDKGPPFDVPCPTCGARAGAWCKRPSGHSGPFVAPHAARVRSSEEAATRAAAEATAAVQDHKDSPTAGQPAQLGFGW